MKNISRRVFIKGMAVAAVATAASSVLAGCNMVPGTEEKGEETGFKALTEVVEYAKDEDVTISITGYEYNATSGLLAFSGKIVNNTSDPLTLTATSAAKTIDVDAYIDAGSNPYAKSQDVIVGGFADNLALETVAAKANDVTAGVREGKIYYKLDDDNKDWKTITLVVEVFATASTPKTVKFVINR